MAIKTSITVQGDKELIAALESLGSPKTTKRVLRAAVRQAAKPVLQQVRTNLRGDSPRRRTGALLRSMATKVRDYQSGAVVAIVGPRSDFVIQRYIDGAVRRIRPAKYAHLVEFGTQPHNIRAGLHPGARPTGFMRRAWFTTRDTAFKVMAREVWAGIAREKFGLERRHGGAGNRRRNAA
jgi:HK97 gp10 family phage protein